MEVRRGQGLNQLIKNFFALAPQADIYGWFIFKDIPVVHRRGGPPQHQDERGACLFQDF